MKRVEILPRQNFEQTNAGLGFDFSEIDGNPYWQETHAYEFTEKEILHIEQATNELQQMSLALVDEVLKHDHLFQLYG